MTDVKEDFRQAPQPVPAAPAKTNVSDIVTQVEADVAEAAPASNAVQSLANAIPVLKGEPALIIGTLVAVIIAVLAVTNVIDVSTSVGVVTSVAPFVGGILTRFFVKPAVK